MSASNGGECFCVVARDPRGKSTGVLSANHQMSIDDARDLDRKAIRSIRKAPPDSFEGVAAEWFKRHVLKRGLRSASELDRFMRQHLFPAWSGRDLTPNSSRCRPALLDRIEDESGARQADYSVGGETDI